MIPSHECVRVALYWRDIGSFDFAFSYGGDACVGCVLGIFPFTSCDARCDSGGISNYSQAIIKVRRKQVFESYLDLLKHYKEYLLSIMPTFKQQFAVEKRLRESRKQQPHV